MGDNLPLLPDKDRTLCADVRPILREVFRDLHYLPTSKLLGKDDEKLNVENASTAREVEWVNNISSEYKKLHQQEIKLQQEHAKRLARDTPRNQYQLHSPVSSSEQTWKLESALLRRRDLKPSLEQNSNCKESLWVKNILNRSSGNVTVAEKMDIPVILNVPPLPFDEGSLQSISMGEIISRPPPSTPVLPLPPAAPNYIVSIPSKFDFMNFKVGDLHTQSLRLVNISKFEVRLSVRPPCRRELDIELCSRLVVTSGSAAEMKIHFRPKDVRAFTEQLDICVSNGQRLCIPIACFMEPPSLEILVNNKGSSSSSSSKSIDTSDDIIDLGTKLLGDNHRAEFLLRCNAKHASFFLLSEDSWINYTIEFKAHQSGKGKYYGIAVDSFFISPVRWSGGEDVNGLAVYKATEIGLHTAALRVISSTAISRPLHLVADTIMFTPKHITIQAHEKDYDICSEGDPSCEYYVNLGVAFPHRSLTATINITNHSPLYYNYYWSSRSWGVCCCWNYSEELLDVEESDRDLCPGAREAKEKSKKGEEIYNLIDKDLKQVLLDETINDISPHSTTQLTVRVPDSGSELGIQRSVLMLTLKDIPKESITEEHECLIVSTKDIAKEVIPETSLDSSVQSRQVCEVLCAQMEVWWEVVPVRFTLDPPVLRLPHSRRIQSVTPQIRAIQLYGVSNIQAKLELMGNLPSLLTLTPEQPTITTFTLPLLSDRHSHTDVIRLTSEDNEWFASTSIEQYCETRHPSIKPSFTWLGVVPPGATVTASLTICNDTYEDIEWCATIYRWWGERGLADACKNQPPCVTCHSRACTCSILTPTSGTLKQSQRDKLIYKTSAPDSDGCVMTLVRVHRTDTSTIGSSLEARAALLAYRVLSPHLVLRVLPCYGDKRGACEGCSLDAGGGAPVLRPRAALARGERSCCRLRLANVAPLAASVLWEPALEGDDVLGVTFLPNEFKVDGYSEIDIMVVLEAKRVTDRRIFIRKADVLHSKKPLYLVIDAAVSGVEVVIEFPTGDKETLSFASFKLMQKEDLKEHNTTVQPRTIEDIFTDYDLKRKKQQENICYCDYDMVYIPPVKKPAPPKDIDDSSHQIEILEEPPKLTRVCPCTNCQKPDLPEACESYCLQFKQVPLRTVRSCSIVLRNLSRIDTRWRASVRRWPRRHSRTIEKEQWAGDVREAGVVLQCEPASGDLRACTKTVVQVSVYADCWGLYHDQILIQIENLEPLILDVWIEAVGLPLEFALRPNDIQTQPTLWLSNTDPERAILIKNTSRADLLVHAFIIKEHEYPQDVLPFRLYVRLFDVPRPTCPCVTTYKSENSSISESLFEDMDTSVELFLTSDHGVQDDTFFQVESLECLIGAGERATYKLSLFSRHESAPDSVLLLRSTFVRNTGDNWYRPDPALQFVRLRQTQRSPRLQASCSEINVNLCALDLPCDDVIRVRKRFNVQNIGDGQLELYSTTEAPWSLDFVRQICAAHCTPKETNKTAILKLCLPPRSATEMVVEVTVRTNEVWPEVDATYLPRSKSTSLLYFSDPDDAVLLLKRSLSRSLTFIQNLSLIMDNPCIPLILEIEYPVLTMEPEIIDFGDVSDGSTRKSYITVTHSSLTTTIHLETSWTGDDQFRLWPPNLTLSPGTSARIYIEYTAVWLSDASAGGTARVRALGPAARWCAARAHATARARRGASRAARHADCTDDTSLIPRDVLLQNK